MLCFLMGTPRHLPAPLQAFKSIAHVRRPPGLVVLESVVLNTTENEDCIIDESGDVLKLFPIVSAIRRALDCYGFDIVKEQLRKKSGGLSRVVLHATCKSAGGFE